MHSFPRFASISFTNSPQQGLTQLLVDEGDKVIRFPATRVAARTNTGESSSQGSKSRHGVDLPSIVRNTSTKCAEALSLCRDVSINQFDVELSE